MHNVYRRPVRLVVRTLEVLAESAEPVPWITLWALVDPGGNSPRKTVENVFYDLVSFGAVHRVGKAPTRRGGRDTRALVLTPLGRAWMHGELPDPVRAGSDDEAWDDDDLSDEELFA